MNADARQRLDDFADEVDATNPGAQPRQQHPEPGEEQVPFVIVVDCVAAPSDHDGMLPITAVLEDIRQALAARSGVEARLAHVGIREFREDIMQALDAAIDDEERRRG